MKIRIKDNSVRLRLTKSDVANLKSNGMVECKSVFSEKAVFQYSIVVNNSISEMRAMIENNKITVEISKEYSNILTDTDEITVKSWMDNGEDGKLFILVEKDLQCLDPTHEDQSDMYPNPNSSC